MVDRVASLTVQRDGNDFISMAESVYHLRGLPRAITSEFINAAFRYNRDVFASERGGIFASDLQIEAIADLCSMAFGMHYLCILLHYAEPSMSYLMRVDSKNALVFASEVETRHSLDQAMNKLYYLSLLLEWSVHQMHSFLKVTRYMNHCELSVVITKEDKRRDKRGWAFEKRPPYSWSLDVDSDTESVSAAEEEGEAAAEGNAEVESDAEVAGGANVESDTEVILPSEAEEEGESEAEGNAELADGANIEPQGDDSERFSPVSVPDDGVHISITDIHPDLHPLISPFHFSKYGLREYGPRAAAPQYRLRETASYFRAQDSIAGRQLVEFTRLLSNIHLTSYRIFEKSTINVVSLIREASAFQRKSLLNGDGLRAKQHDLIGPFVHHSVDQHNVNHYRPVNNFNQLIVDFQGPLSAYERSYRPRGMNMVVSMTRWLNNVCCSMSLLYKQVRKGGHTITGGAGELARSALTFKCYGRNSSSLGDGTLWEAVFDQNPRTPDSAQAQEFVLPVGTFLSSSKVLIQARRQLAELRNAASIGSNATSRLVDRLKFEERPLLGLCFIIPAAHLRQMIIDDCGIMNRLLVLLSSEFVEFLAYHGVLTLYCCDFDWLTDSGAYEPEGDTCRTENALHNEVLLKKWYLPNQAVLTSFGNLTSSNCNVALNTIKAGYLQAWGFMIDNLKDLTDQTTPEVRRQLWLNGPALNSSVTEPLNWLPPVEDLAPIPALKRPRYVEHGRGGRGRGGYGLPSQK